MSGLVGAAVALAVLFACGPRGRPPRTLAAGPVEHGRTRTGPGVTLRSVLRPPASRPTQPDLTLLVTEVAARLRAGAEPGAAWAGALGRPVTPTGPAVEDLVAGSQGPDHRAAARVVVVAGRLAAELGTPLAPLLDEVARELAAAADAQGERRAALAGPRATARVLTGLPVLGVALGTAVGADPVAVLGDGGIGTTCLVTGAALVVAGRAWSGRLARAAAAAGGAP